MPSSLRRRIASATIAIDADGEALRRLVHDHEHRIGHQRATDREHLLLAAAQLVAPVMPALLEPREQLEHTADAGRRRAGNREVLVHGQRREHPAPLRHEAEMHAVDPVRRHTS